MSQHFELDGRWHPHPPTKELAKELNRHIYTDVDGYCTGCNRHDVSRYVCDDTCYGCMMNGSVDSITQEKNPGFNDVKRTIAPDEKLHTRGCPNGGHLYHTKVGGTSCLQCKKVRAQDAQRRQAARDVGQPTYVSMTPCRQCKESSYRDVATDQCSCFEEHASPRQKAKATGQSHYTPDDPCPHCGTRAERAVANGRCKGCAPKAVIRTPSARQGAIELGLKWYPASKPCRHCGKTALRYVANGRCSECGG